MALSYLYCGAWSFKQPAAGIVSFACQNGTFEGNGIWGQETEAQSILTVAGKYLVAVSEKRSGAKLVSYRIGEKGELAKCCELPLDTPLPSYVAAAPNGRYVFASSMGSPAVKMIRLEADGTLVPTDEWLLTGHSVTNRQECAKTHSVRISPDGRLLAAANLGADEVELFKIDYERERIRLIQSVPVDFGRQPRHMAFHPSGEYLYLLTESGNRIYVYRMLEERLRELAAYDTLSPDGPQTGMAADIVIGTDGKYLYSSNRAQNNIAVWRTLPSGMLDLVGHYPCGGEGPRGLHISPDGDFLFCANNDSSTVTVFSLNKETGIPGEIVQTLNVPFAACVRSYREKEE